VVAAPFVAMLLWLGVAFALSFVDGAGDKGEADGSVEVRVVSNGYHASLVLPVRNEAADWSAVFDPSEARAAPARAEWIMLGWGDRAFFMETRTLADVRPGTLVGALLGLGDTALHVVWLERPDLFGFVAVVRLSPHRYAQLVKVVQDRVVYGAGGRAIAHPGMGYGAADTFYRANGRYSPWYTCNEWVADALRAAGIAVPVWAPLPQALVGRLPRA
jgi:uncharacterized protein (TIGR02117 family)